MNVLAAIAAAALTITPSARAMQPGELVVLSVSSDAPLTEVRARAFNTNIAGFAVDQNDPRHWQVLIGIDLDITPGPHPVVVTASTAAGPLESTYELTVQPKKFPTRRLFVDEALVNPPPSALPRIAAEAKEQQAIWDTPATSRLWSARFVRPVAQAANSAFGTRSVFNGQPRGAHGGADFLSPAGTPVKAPNAGRVMLAKDLYFAGNTVIIDHGLGVFSFLCHLSKINVEVGDMVTPGQIIGLVGATGRVTGAHLHWTVKVSGARVDPLALLALLGR
jgi:murein DD-endopeptidase MepM/ murein hydrolase activator NlpD